MSLVSIQRSSTVRYPRGEDSRPLGSGEIPSLVGECLRSYFARQGEAYDEGALLGRWIKPGDRVWILPNIVMHRRPFESKNRFLSKCTHGSVLRAVADYTVQACRDANLVKIGNAPIQSCDYTRASGETGMAAIREFYSSRGGRDIGPHDLRSFSSRRTWYGALLSTSSSNDNMTVRIDLGERSHLEELFYGRLPQLRVADYPPESTMSFHERGKHVYVMSRKVLEADVIVSVPKLKTHQKVGVTCAIKGAVGAVARKECLAHHRTGSPESGGDEYPRASFLRHLASLLADQAGHFDSSTMGNVRRVLGKAYIKLLRIGPGGITGGGWHGNDTTWRMALDVATILRYARADGTISERPIRPHIGLVDGIVGGSGEGPLRPSAHFTGAVIFSPDICALDAACALIMGYDPLRIPLIHHSFEGGPFPLSEGPFSDISLSVNGNPISAGDLLHEFWQPYKAPKGWRGHIEAKHSHIGD